MKAFIRPCPEGQHDVNGDCFEPQTIAWYNKVSGCGCIRIPFAERLQCPSNYTLYNNSCVTQCPDGYEDIRSTTGNVTSLYCMQACPKNSPTNGGLCIKEYFTRQQHKIINNAITPVFSLPENMAGVLAKSPNGHTLGSRYQANQTIQQNLATGNSSPPGAGLGGAFDNWNALFENPGALIVFIIILGALYFGGSSLFPLIAEGIGTVFKGFGSLFGGELSGAGSLISSGAATVGTLAEGSAKGAGALLASTGRGVGSVIEGTAAGAGSLIKNTASGAGSLIRNTAETLGNVENAVGRDVSAAIATPGANLAARNARAPIDAERAAIRQLELAQAALNRVRKQNISELNT